MPIKFELMTGILIAIMITGGGGAVLAPYVQSQFEGIVIPIEKI